MGPTELQACKQEAMRHQSHDTRGRHKFMNALRSKPDYELCSETSGYKKSKLSYWWCTIVRKKVSCWVTEESSPPLSDLVSLAEHAYQDMQETSKYQQNGSSNKQQKGQLLKGWQNRPFCCLSTPPNSAACNFSNLHATVMVRNSGWQKWIR